MHPERSFPLVVRDNPVPRLGRYLVNHRWRPLGSSRVDRCSGRELARCSRALRRRPCRRSPSRLRGLFRRGLRRSPVPRRCPYRRKSSRPHYRSRYSRELSRRRCRDSHSDRSGPSLRPTPRYRVPNLHPYPARRPPDHSRRRPVNRYSREGWSPRNHSPRRRRYRGSHPRRLHPYCLGWFQRNREPNRYPRRGSHSRRLDPYRPALRRNRVRDLGRYQDNRRYCSGRFLRELRRSRVPSRRRCHGSYLRLRDRSR